jgi:hypothetical protein
MFQTRVVCIAASSTKYFVARQQHKRNSLNFHDNSEQFYIVTLYVYCFLQCKLTLWRVRVTIFALETQQ